MSSDSSLHVLLVVRALFFNPQGQILLVKRNGERQYNPLKWELPGGKIKQTEEITEALERIVHQETGLVVINMAKEHFIHNRYVTEPGKYKGFNYFEIALTADYVSGDVQVSSKEHVAFDWFSLKQALALDLSLETKRFIVKWMHKREQEKLQHGKVDAPVVVVSRALIQNKKGEYLLLQRSESKSYPGTWEIPGGKLNSFESLIDHLKREVLEETGLLIEIDAPSQYVHSFIPKDGPYRGVTFLNILNTAHLRAGKIKLSSEHVKATWLKPDEILAYPLAEYVRESLTELLARNKQA